MLTTLAILTLVLFIGAGNLALGFGLAVYLGHGPSQGWQALFHWPRKTTAAASGSKSASGHH
jgi:hypothetical protein